MAAFEGASPNARLLTGQTPGSEANAQRFGGAFSVSMLTHVAGLLLILFIMRDQPQPGFLRQILGDVAAARQADQEGEQAHVHRHIDSVECRGLSGP